MNSVRIKKSVLVDQAKSLLVEISNARMKSAGQKALIILRGQKATFRNWLLRRPQPIPTADEIGALALVLAEKENEFEGQRRDLQRFIRAAPHILDEEIALTEEDLETFGY